MIACDVLNVIFGLYINIFNIPITNMPLNTVIGFKSQVRAIIRGKIRRIA